MNFIFKTFDQLTPGELYEILQLRSEVFVVEQNCVYNDLDGLDKDAVHMFCRNETEIIAYSRLLKPGTRFPDYSIGRVVVKKEKRGSGLGIKSMKKAKEFMVDNWEAKRIKVSAQKYLQRFYEDLGFAVVTEEYLEDGIPHIGMEYIAAYTE